MSGEAAGRIAAALTERGLGAPARLLADAHRPLAPLITDLGAALGPLLASFGGHRGRDLALLLNDDDALARLTERLDELEPRHGEPG